MSSIVRVEAQQPAPLKGFRETHLQILFTRSCKAVVTHDISTRDGFSGSHYRCCWYLHCRGWRIHFRFQIPHLSQQSSRETQNAIIKIQMVLARSMRVILDTSAVCELYQTGYVLALVEYILPYLEEDAESVVFKDNLTKWIIDRESRFIYAIWGITVIEKTYKWDLCVEITK